MILISVSANEVFRLGCSVGKIHHIEIEVERGFTGHCAAAYMVLNFGQIITVTFSFIRIHIKPSCYLPIQNTDNVPAYTFQLQHSF
jgi:hypothetical protein